MLEAGTTMVDKIISKAFLPKRRLGRKEWNDFPRDEYLEMLPQIEEVYDQTSLWHGTGRFQHIKNENGKEEVIDLLSHVIQDNGLIPQLDVFDAKTGPRMSLSLARSRMYARPYSEMYLNTGKFIANANGSSKDWFHYFILTSLLAVSIEIPRVLTISSIKGTSEASYSWLRKINKDAGGLFKIFSVRSDIPNNYLLLIGISSDGIVPAESGKYISKHEVRTSEKVPFNRFTHLEVPYEKVEETRDLLEKRGKNLLVIPIEFGEEYTKVFTREQLISGNTLTAK